MQRQVHGQKPRPLQDLSPDSLRRMHRRSVETPAAVRALLSRLCDSGLELTSGVDRRSAPRTSRVERVLQDRVLLRSQCSDRRQPPQIYFGFELDRVRYFFAAEPLAGGGDEWLEIAMPLAIYEAERRDLLRVPVERMAGASHRVELHNGSVGPHSAVVCDWSYQGIGVALPEQHADGLAANFELRFLDGERRGDHTFAQLRHRAVDPDRPGWVRLGLAISKVPISEPVRVEKRSSILGGAPPQRAWRRIALAGAVAREAPARVIDRLRSARPAASRSAVDVIEYPNQAGQILRAIVNRTSSELTAGPTQVVVIPPAWGRTKETLLPLALTLVRTFEKAGRPLAVVRFDGSNRRGESHIDPEFRAPGDEYLGFKFSQAAGDITATCDFLASSADFRAAEIFLVTYSLGAVEGRRALALDRGRRVKGWVSVVGMVDLQSGLRTVSGGVDFAYGYMNGVEFGRHELVGVVADMGRTGRDAMEHRLVFSEDARCDMAEIKIPVSWIHGRYDAWMDLWRVQELLSAGDTSRRRLLEVPTGHQMRSSREALETFQLVAQEVGAMALGGPVTPALPDLSELERVGKAERSRRPPPQVDLRSFWHDYLLGRDRKLGIELMTSTTAYGQLMAVQLDRLDLCDGDTVVDLGSGAGDFPLAVAQADVVPRSLHLIEVDLVTPALARARERFAAKVTRPANGRPTRICVSHLAADLDRSGQAALPLLPGSAEAVMASLLISYLSHPASFLRETFALLKPGGRIVLSTLKRDADISRIYVDGIAELPPDRVRARFGDEASREFDALQRRFLNDAARLLDLEEQGLFRFWDAAELVELVEKAGFIEVEAAHAFGDPPQAVVVSARRP